MPRRRPPYSSPFRSPARPDRKVHPRGFVFDCSPAAPAEHNEAAVQSCAACQDPLDPGGACATCDGDDTTYSGLTLRAQDAPARARATAMLLVLVFLGALAFVFGYGF